VSGIPRTTQELADALSRVTDPSSIRDVLLNQLAAEGQVVRTRDDQFNNHLVLRPQTPEAPLPGTEFRFEREVKFHPESGKRTLIIRANTKEDLDALERQVTG